MRVAIDPNVRTIENHTYAGREDLFGNFDDLHVGDYIVAMAAETNMVLDATVVRIDPLTHVIHMSVDWSSARADVTPTRWRETVYGGGRTVAV